MKEHVEWLKKDFPDLEVQVRRDRDGYAIVKTLHKPKYKYDIKKIESFDANAEMALVKESLDDILKTVIGGQSIHELDKQTLESKLMMVME